MKLDGLWDFVFLPETDDSVLDLSALCYNDLQPVPGCFDTDERYKFLRGRGTYRTTVICGGFMRLEIEALGLRGEIWFDCHKIGDIETAYMNDVRRFDTGAYGEHELVLVVDNRFDRTPSANFRDFYDFYGFGGIYRSVKITPETPCWIDRISIITRDFRTGKVEVKVVTGGAIPEKLRLEIGVDGKPLRETRLDGNEFHTCLDIPDFKLWTPENPNLHELSVIIGESRRNMSFGIRQVAAREGKLFLNGEPVKLLGYNRHDSHPDFGAAVPGADLVRDLKMIKAQGANFIRGSHYPQSEEMLSLCDRLGLLVWEESLGWGDRLESLSDGEFCRKQLEQTVRMVRKSINHPCVVIWGFMNELHADSEAAQSLIMKLAEAVRREDDSRPVSYATWLAEKDLCYGFVDILTFNIYSGWYYRNSGPFFNPDDVTGRIDELLEFAREKHPGKPVVIGEIGAASLPGDHSGLRWSEEYQAELCVTALRKAAGDDRIAGLAIWQFCNARTYVIDNTQMRPRGFNNKGVLDEYRRPKSAWYAIGRFFRENQGGNHS